MPGIGTLRVKVNINDIVTESLMSVKDSIIEALNAENLKLKSRVDSLGEKTFELDISRNKLEQYTRRNNIEIQRIPATVLDDHLEHKVLDICKSINLTVEYSDIKGCHRIGWRGLLGNVRSSDELVKFTVPSAQKVL